MKRNSLPHGATWARRVSNPRPCAPRSTTETVRAQIDAITPSRPRSPVWTTRMRYSGLMFGFIRNMFAGS